MSASQQKRELSPAATMGTSAGISGAALIGVPMALRRGSSVRGVLKAAAKGGAVASGLGYGSALIGNRLLGGAPAKDQTAYTKRGAVGGTVGGAAVGALAGLLAIKTQGGRKALVKAARDWRPAAAVRRSPMLAPLIGATGGAVYGGYQGADDGSAVDVIRSARRQRSLTAALRDVIQFAEMPLSGRLAADRYRKKIQDDDLDRGAANIGRGAAAGALAGMLVKRPRVSVLRRALAGSVIGGVSVGVIRKITEGGKDLYGERSRQGKQAERLPQLAGLTAAGVLAARRVKRRIGLAAKGKTITFGGYQQLRGEKNRFVDPLEVAAGTAAAYDDNGAVNLPVRHAQVVRAALNKGRAIQTYGKRAGGLVRDTTDALRGVPKVDSRGRPQRREWEKPWFRNVAGTVASGAALLGHAALMKRNPGYRRKVADVVRRGKTAANEVVPDLFPMSAGSRPLILAERIAAPLVQFDVTAPDWDVRDQRGRSARVFAPGSRPRQRREKEWYEKSDTQRKLLGGLAVVAGVGGLVGGYKLGTSRGVRNVRRAMAQKGWETRRAAAAENEVIERMKKRPPGGNAVS